MPAGEGCCEPPSPLQHPGHHLVKSARQAEKAPDLLGFSVQLFRLSYRAHYTYFPAIASTTHFKCLYLEVMSVLPTKLLMLIKKKKKKNKQFLFVALCRFSLVASWGYSSLPCAGCFWWILLLLSTGSGPTGISSDGWQALEHGLGEGKGNPLQYSCLENPRDRGAWWAAVYGVAQSWT